MARGIDRVQQELQQLEDVRHRNQQLENNKVVMPSIVLRDMTIPGFNKYIRLITQTADHNYTIRGILDGKKMQLQNRLPQIVKKQKLLSMM